MAKRTPEHDAYIKNAADLLAALKKNKKTLTTFEGFSYRHRTEYIEWIEQAKKEETRSRRIRHAVDMMGQGQSKNWKYQR